jgi:hypothetical protein
MDCNPLSIISLDLTSQNAMCVSENFLSKNFTEFLLSRAESYLDTIVIRRPPHLPDSTALGASLRFLITNLHQHVMFLEHGAHRCSKRSLKVQLTYRLQNNLTRLATSLISGASFGNANRSMGHTSEEQNVSK